MWMMCVVCAVVMSLGGAAYGVAVPFTTASIATGTVVRMDPQIDGKLVAWTSTPLGIPGSSTYVTCRDLDAGTTFNIGGSGSDGDQGDVDLSSGRIVYESNAAGNSDIRVSDTLLAADYAIASSGADEVDPAIDGNFIVWRDDATDILYYRDLSRGFSAAVPGSDAVELHDVDNGRIVWVEGRSVYSYLPHRVGPQGGTIYTAPVGATIETLQAHGDRVALTVRGSDDDAYVVDVSLGEATNLVPSSAFDESAPSVFHTGVAWQTNSGGDTDLYYKMLGDVVSNVAVDAVNEYAPAVYGRRVAYGNSPGLFVNDIWMATGPREMARTSGDNRYATAAAASRAYFSDASYAVLCTGENFPDALSAAPLAKALDAPLLLTRRNSIPPETLAELGRLHLNAVYVIGSDSAISWTMMTQYTDDTLTPCEFIGGANRYATSALIARKIRELTAYDFRQRNAFFARGDTFPDALAVGPVAAGALAPVLLVQPNAVPAEISSVVNDLDLTSGVVVGSADAVSSGVQGAIETLLRANGGDEHPVERWAGATRYETAVEVVEHGLENRWIDLDTLGVATGANFPDALGGGAAMGWYGSPIVITQPTTVPATLSTFLTDHEYDVGRIDVFGGPDVVSDGVKNAIASKLR